MTFLAIRLFYTAYRGWILLALWAALAASVAGLYAWRVHVERDIGREEVRAEWRERDAEQARVNAKETLRRFAAQQHNQELQHAELAKAKDAADRVARASERMRVQHAQAADIWTRTLRNSPTAADLAAAADAIRVSTELLGRARERAGVLARYSDAARIAGVGCERDYDALTVKP
jgi:hypothetical protein